MNTYFAVVHKEDDSAYGISFPDLPGCFSAADVDQDVYLQAQSALALFAQEESPLPAARPIGVLLADPEIGADIAEGAFFIGVPLIVAERKVRCNVLLEPSLVQEIDVIARAAAVSRSEYVAHAVRSCLSAETGAVMVKRSRGGKRGPKQDKRTANRG